MIDTYNIYEKVLTAYLISQTDFLDLVHAVENQLHQVCHTLHVSWAATTLIRS